ncbi:MAG: dehypoxanthine futalosine cyclase [Desulfarculaceae bacterium]|nr:dehypoxanthine futalosine cyclase [Desulfarculaceae bacterium]MCF8072196.1 dehypoxanthine futalosine cyclase [Desulfarculaceae bacterium]MCF8100117.1 dehypoxanthine futalosine cyclase [Desulfarculaceae bacterium]MCF8117234.1 dehypoxanthine futalosine cyclase [Desulfarculaceae bacterium]
MPSAAAQHGELDQALAAAEAGQRLGPEQALCLLEQAELLTLGRLAHAARLRHNPESMVTYAVDRNINTTNVCTSGCRFCAFFRPPGDAEGYVLNREELGQKIDETLALGGTHILIQGGLHPEIGVKATCDTFRFIKQHHPIHIHGLSPPEVVHMAAVDGLSVSEALAHFKEAGLGSIPGGGAEILVDRVRGLIAPGKCGTDDWLAVMAEAHAQGLMTTATMMFGSLDTPAERIEHLERLRALQDQSLEAGQGNFTAFIPWTFQPDHTALSHLAPATAVEYLRMLAVGRLFLDNFPHVQASWVTQGAAIAQTALAFGADDLGTTMIEENVVAAAGVSFRLPREALVRLAEDLDYRAQQRDVFYNPV